MHSYVPGSAKTTHPHPFICPFSVYLTSQTSGLADAVLVLFLAAAPDFFLLSQSPYIQTRGCVDDCGPVETSLTSLQSIGVFMVSFVVIIFFNSAARD